MRTRTPYWEAGGGFLELRLIVLRGILQVNLYPLKQKGRGPSQSPGLSVRVVCLCVRALRLELDFPIDARQESIP